MIKTIASVVFGFFLTIAPTLIFAISPPSLSSPSNNSTISSGPKLTWEPVVDSVQYRVLVDDEVSIKSPYIKSYYLTNTNYSPQLNPGLYYWKVGAKDSNGTWFWSNTWSFILTNSTPIPSPSSTPTPSPTLSPTPSPSLTSSSSFTISNTPSQINSNQLFNVSVNLSLPNNPNEKFYLKGAFKKSDSSNYFGLTKVSGSWIKNGSTYSNQFPITTDSSGNWSGNLEVKPDDEDSGFIGSGGYIFKVGRYKESNNPSVIWSNESNVEITQVSVSIDTDNSESTPQPSINPTNNLLPQTKSVLSKTTSAPKFNYQIASVAAATSSATPSAKAEVKNQKQTSPMFWIGLVFIFAGISSLGYIYLRKR